MYVAQFLPKFLNPLSFKKNMFSVAYLFVGYQNQLTGRQNKTKIMPTINGNTDRKFQQSTICIDIKIPDPIDFQYKKIP